MSGGNLIVEVAFGQSIFSEPSAADWTQLYKAGYDHARDLMAVSIKRGRMHQLGRIEAGTARFVLNNGHGNYWRNNTAGDYTPNVKPLQLIRLRAVFGINHPLFYGVTESITPGWKEERGGFSPIVTVDAVDMFSMLAHYVIPGGTVLAADFTGNRIEAVLDLLGWPAAMRSFPRPGLNTVIAHTAPTGGTNAMDHIQAVIEAEEGLFYQDPDGTFVFQDGDARQVAPLSTLQAKFMDDDTPSKFAYPELMDDLTYIYNQADISGTGITSQSFYDPAAQALQGVRTLARADSQLSIDIEAANQAYILVRRYTESRLRVDNLLILPDAHPFDLYPRVYGYDLGTKINLQVNSTRNPAMINENYHIEAIQHDWNASEDMWETRWQLWNVNQYRVFYTDRQADCDSGYIVCDGTISYAIVQAAAAGVPYNNQATIKVGQANSTPSSDKWQIGRGMVSFNTAELGASADIESAELVVTLAFATTTNARAFDLVVVPPDTVVAPVVDTDYHVLGHQSTDYGHVTIPASLPAGTTLVITLSPTAVGTINKTGVTTFGLRSSRDISETSPGAYAAGNNETVDLVFGPTVLTPRLFVKVAVADVPVPLTYWTLGTSKLDTETKLL
jgi:hypothetical protein